MFETELYTIGHSNVPMETFLDLLTPFGVTALVDVRSQPFSRHTPHFNREALKDALPSGLRYAFMGDSLGGRPSDRTYYDDSGHVLYSRLSSDEEFLRGIETLERARAREKVALLCSEADPLRCHRFLLVTRVLRARGADAASIVHILGDGSTRLDSQLPRQAGLMEESVWRSPLSVLPGHQLSTSSNDWDRPALAH